MKTIRVNQTIIRHISSGQVREDYSVVDGARLVVVYEVNAERDVSLTSAIHLNGTGASAVIVGIVRGSGEGKIMIHTLQHHAAESTASNLLFKSVLTGKSAIDYTGSILVEKVAQKTDAYQRNENLLLDESCRAVSSPALEILANDVRCTHGAIVKTLDPEELWYLASRAIGVSRAREMIARGFLNSAFAALGDDAERDIIESRFLYD